MKKNLFFGFLLSLIVGSLFFSTVSVFAQAPSGGYPPGEEPAPTQKGPDLNVSNPLTGTPNSIEESGKVYLAKFFGGLAGTLLLFVGVVAFAVFVYGGFIWLTSAGNQDKVKKAKATLTWAVLGLFAIFASYVILSVVVQFFATLQQQ